jgi:hypothetical protein
MATVEQNHREDATRLYDKYAKPLESEHTGEYLAITTDGKMVFGTTILEVVRKAKASFGLGTYTFKIGQRAVGKGDD